jgi:hypothetical protein
MTAEKLASFCQNWPISSSNSINVRTAASALQKPGARSAPGPPIASALVGVSCLKPRRAIRSEPRVSAIAPIWPARSPWPLQGPPRRQDRRQEFGLERLRPKRPLTAGAIGPWRYEFRLEFDFPAAVLGPLLRLELARFAAICLCEATCPSPLYRNDPTTPLNHQALRPRRKNLARKRTGASVETERHWFGPAQVRSVSHPRTRRG